MAVILSLSHLNLRHLSGTLVVPGQFGVVWAADGIAVDIRLCPVAVLRDIPCGAYPGVFV